MKDEKWARNETNETLSSHDEWRHFIKLHRYRWPSQSIKFNADVETKKSERWSVVVKCESLEFFVRVRLQIDYAMRKRKHRGDTKSWELILIFPLFSWFTLNANSKLEVVVLIGLHQNKTEYNRNKSSREWKISHIFPSIEFMNSSAMK